MLFEQGGGCAICHGPQIATGRAFDIDHNHITKQVRGLLCNLCNTAIGKFEENPVLLRRAADYLEYYATLWHGHPVGVGE